MMNITKYLIQTGITLPLLYLIISCMIQFRCNRKQRIIDMSISYLVTILLTGLLFYIGIDYNTITILSLLTTGIPSFICLLRIAKYRDGSFIFIYLCITVLSSIITSVSYIITYYIPGGNWSIQGVIRIIMLIILYIICKRYLSEKLITTLNNYSIQWGLYIILPVIHMIIWSIFIIISSNVKDREDTLQIPYVIDILPKNLPILLFYLLTTFYAVILLVSIIVKNYTFILDQEEKKVLQFQISSLKNLQRHYDEKNESLRIYRHDMRHHFKNIALLLEDVNIEEAQKYLIEISDNLSTIKTISYCSNAVINSLLSYYHEKCKEESIHYDCMVELRENSLQKILDTELGAVVANILENALHAVLKIPKNKKRYISFKLLHRNQQYILKCENTFCDQIYLSQSGRPISREKGHGIGTQSILAFEHKYNANISYTVENNQFSICLLFSE